MYANHPLCNGKQAGPFWDYSMYLVTDKGENLLFNSIKELMIILFSLDLRYL